jgi:DNA-binding transcriptional regulator GbsR (MarR family)
MSHLHRIAVTLENISTTLECLKKTQAKSKIVISAEDASEIASAIESKIYTLKNSNHEMSNTDYNIDEWIGHLEDILENIGADGKNLVTR